MPSLVFSSQDQALDMICFMLTEAEQEALQASTLCFNIHTQLLHSVPLYVKPVNTLALTCHYCRIYSQTVHDLPMQPTNIL